jgi:hypothetical protein
MREHSMLLTVHDPDADDFLARVTPMPDQRTQPSAPATQPGHEATSCSLYRSPANQVIA